MTHAPQETNHDAHHQARLAILRSFRATFQPEHGQRVLTHLHTVTDTLPGKQRPAFLPAADGKYCPITAAFRDGRRSIILEIEAILSTPEDAEPPKPPAAVKPRRAGRS